MCRTLFFLFLLVAACSGSPFAPQILGGSDADIADFPYVLEIERDGFGHYCGGVILSPDWALTDAWCAIIPADFTQFSIRSGSAIRGNGTLHSVVQWIYHPQSDVYYSEYDFALVQVDPPFEFGENVAAVNLPQQNQTTPDGAEAVFAGWGQVISSPSSSTRQLQFANITVFGEAECFDILGVNNYHTSKLCVQDPKGQVAHCYRDEGGPVVIDGTLFGVVQWPDGCADPLEVQVFSRVASVRNWIDETIAASS